MSSFCTAKATHIFFSKKFQHICVSLDVNFNESLTNNIVSFEQLGPGLSTYMNSEGSNHTAHPCSLTGVFVGYLVKSMDGVCNIQQYIILLMSVILHQLLSYFIHVYHLTSIHSFSMYQSFVQLLHWRQGLKQKQD